MNYQSNQLAFPATQSLYSSASQQMTNNNNITSNNILFYNNIGISTTPRYIDLLQERNLLSYSLEDHKITLPSSVCNPEVKCSSNIFRCTMSVIPESTELLNKTRLPMGLTLHPFRDLKNLTVIQTVIQRCRSCRAYINPYIYFVDARHWKCNLCYRMNDLPEDFCWDPTTKTFGDPTRRPELQNATIEYIAPSEYTLREPQPSLYLFIFDVSASAVDCGYLHTFSEQLYENIDNLPGDERTKVAFIGVDSVIHFFQFTEVDVQPKHIIVYDIDDAFFPVNNGLLVDLKVFKNAILKFIQTLSLFFETNNSDKCCLGAALNIGKDLIKDIGGRISVFLVNEVNIGPGILNSNNNVLLKNKNGEINLRSSTDFYKLLALECIGKQIAIDLFVLSKRYIDLVTLANISKYSSGTIFYFPFYDLIRNKIEVLRFKKTLTRYFTRKIGFEAVLRIRYSKGLNLHTFYGNFFVRSTDLLALANVNPDSALAVQIQIEESLSKRDNVCFQAALLYTSSRGDRRIRVHTLCLPVSNDFLQIFNYFDIKAATSFLSKMAVERALNGTKLIDCREALINSAIDALLAYNRFIGHRSTSIFVPIEGHLKFFPLFILGLLKNRAFTSSLSNSLHQNVDLINIDYRVSNMLMFKTASLEKILLDVCPALFAVHNIDHIDNNPQRLPLSYEKINRDGVYLLDTGNYIYLYVCLMVESSTLEKIFGVNNFNALDENISLPFLSNNLSERLNEFIRQLYFNRGSFVPLIIIKENSRLRDLFVNRLIEDRTESSHSFVEFLQYLKREMNIN